MEPEDKSLPLVPTRAKCIQFTSSHTISLRSILILSSHLRLGLSSGLSSSCFPTKVLYAILVYSMCATCPANLILDMLTLIIYGEAYKVWSSLCSHLQPPATFSLLGPHILLSTLIPNTFHLYSSLILRDQVSHPYKTTEKLQLICQYSSYASPSCFCASKQIN
jgi:hypothetical protein